jgi:hypothetical protein
MECPYGMDKCFAGCSRCQDDILWDGNRYSENARRGVERSILLRPRRKQTKYGLSLYEINIRYDKVE